MRCLRAWVKRAPYQWSAVMAETGANRHRSVERREAQAPTSLGLRVPGGGPDGSPMTRGQVPSQRTCHGSLASSHEVSQTPGASRRSIPAAAGRKKGKGRARPPSKNKTPGPLSIGFSAFPRQRQRVPRHVPKNRQPFRNSRNQNTSREFDAWARNHASRSMGVAVGTGAGRVKV